MSSTTIGARSCGVCTNLRSGILSCLARGSCQKRVLPSYFHFLVIGCAIEGKYSNEIDTLLA